MGGALVGPLVSPSLMLQRRCVCYCRTFAGQAIALKIASLGSQKHSNLKHQFSCLLAVRSLWGHCVPGLELAGPLLQLGHEYGLGTTLLQGRHPESGECRLVDQSDASSWHAHQIRPALYRLGLVVNQ